MANVYTIKELQNLNSEREGVMVECETLRGAKASASKRQCFEGTVMTIEDKTGQRVAWKKDNKWFGQEGWQILGMPSGI